MKKRFGIRTRGRHEKERYQDEVLDFDEDFDDEYDEYPDDEIDDRYEDDEYEDDEDYYREEDRYEDDDDDRYSDEEDDYREDDRYEDDEEDEYPEDRYEDDDIDDRHDDEEDEYPEDRYEDDDVDDRYADEDDDYRERGRYADDEDEEDYYRDDRYEDEYEDYEDDVDDEVYYPGDNRRSDRGGRGRRGRRNDREDRESVFAKIGTFLAGTTAIERIAAIFAILILAGAIMTGSFYVSAKNNRNQIESFAEVGSTMPEINLVGESGLIAVADAERAKAMAASLVSDDAAVLGESREVEEEVPDDAENVTIKMTVTSIKSDIKVKFINSQTNKLVANLPLEIEVVGPDGTKVTYNDHDQDGIIYKKDITKGDYKVTPKALPSGYENYKLEIKTKTVTVKDTVEMKVVDVSNEVKKESQVNASKEDTAVKTEVESKLADTVEWVESTKTAAGESNDGTYTYEEVKKDDIPNPTQSSMIGTRDWMFLGFARGRSENPDDKEMSVSSTSIEMTVGEDKTVSASSDGVEVGITLTSENNEVVTTEGNKINAVGPGSAKVTVSAAGYKSVEISVTVNAKSENPVDPPVEEKKKFSVDGKTIELTVDSSPVAIGSETPDGIQYSGYDSSVIKVENGTVTGLKGGSTTITISAPNYDDATVTVKVNKKTTEIKIEPASIKKGDSAQITVSPSDVSYEVTSGSEFVELDKSTGKIKGKAKGKATITIAETDKYAKSEATVEVTEETPIKVEKDTLTVEVSNSVQIKVTEPDASKVSFKSEDEKKATVDKTGKVTGVSVCDKVGIKLTAEGYADTTVYVAVTAKEGDKVVPMTFTKLTICEGQSIKASSTDKNATIKLESANSNVASVSDTTITGKAPGETTIKVTATGYKENTITIKVVSKGTTLKDKNGNTLYVLNSDGSYREANYGDYYSGAKLYKRKAATTYRYTGWQTIGGKTYFYDKNGNYVTGEQVIQGAKYTFGSDGALQSGQGTMGIDVSKWNGNIDWAAVKNSGVNFVIIRCGYRGSSEGALIEDPKFRANINGAQNAGIRVGVYFFTQAVNEVEAVEEASMVINLIKGYNISYPVYLDVEASHGRGDGISAAQRTANIKAFCGTIQNAGYKAGVYANKTWFTSYINTSQITNYRIWLAQYASAVTYTGSRYDMWQYSSKGRVTGINGFVDMNICY